MEFSQKTQDALAKALSQLEAEIAIHSRELEQLTATVDEKEELADGIRQSLNGHLKSAERTASASGPYAGLTLRKAVMLAARAKGGPATVAELGKMAFDGGYRGTGNISDYKRVVQNLASLFSRQKEKEGGDFPFTNEGGGKWSLRPQV